MATEEDNKDAGADDPFAGWAEALEEQKRTDEKPADAEQGGEDQPHAVAAGFEQPREQADGKPDDGDIQPVFTAEQRHGRSPCCASCQA